MELEIVNEPFPHVIAREALSASELELVWREVSFFLSPEKLNRPGIDHGAGGLGGLTNSRAADLNAVYNRIEVSDIAHYATQLTHAMGQAGANEWPHFYRAARLDFIRTKLRYYHDGDAYAKHNDWHQEYLMFLYINKEPKIFSGGRLLFEDHSYIFEASNNTAIFLPGYINHAVELVTIPENEYWAGRGRVSITQFACGPRSERYGSP